jgi:hypothetical protein
VYSGRFPRSTIWLQHINYMATNPYVQALGEDLVKGLEELSQDGTEIVYDVNGRGEVLGSRPQALSRIREILIGHQDRSQVDHILA